MHLQGRVGTVVERLGYVPDALEPRVEQLGQLVQDLQVPPDDGLRPGMSDPRSGSTSHWFGTDEVGRDLLSRMIRGARASLSAGVIAVSIAVFAGVPIGMLAGYLGGRVDAVIGRLTDAMLAIPFLILAIALAEASLSCLGLGQQPPAPSWGSMLNTEQRFLTQAPWMAIFPGLAIFLTVPAFNLFGDGLRDALDPKR